MNASHLERRCYRLGEFGLKICELLLAPLFIKLVSIWFSWWLNKKDK